MSEQVETSAVRFNEPSNPRRSRVANRTLRNVTARSGPVETGGSSLVVNDVLGPIVTGVLGCD
jgi:hypothetical protein